MRQFTAGPNDAGGRLSRFVQSVTAALPTSLLYKSFRNGRIKVNKKKAKPDYRLAEGDCIELYIVDEFFPERAAEAAPSAAPKAVTTKSAARPRAPFQVVFEDTQLLIVHKPAGVLCHSDNTGDPALIDAILAYLSDKGDYDPARENAFAPALCNRIDRGTEGLVIAAKTAAALRGANELIREGKITKSYLCIAAGRCESGVYEAWHRRLPDSKTVDIVKHAREGFKPIRTGVELLRFANGLGLYRVTLFTGRTHQIRAHMRFLGHPLVGDKKYGDPAVNQQYPMANQALCACEIHFDDDLAGSPLKNYAGKTVQNPFCTLEAAWVALTNTARG